MQVHRVTWRAIALAMSNRRPGCYPSGQPALVAFLFLLASETNFTSWRLTMKRLFLAVLSAPVIIAQVMDDPVVLKIDVENRVLYRNNVSDVSKLGKEPGPVAATENIPFVSGL